MSETKLIQIPISIYDDSFIENEKLFHMLRSYNNKIEYTYDEETNVYDINRKNASDSNRQIEIGNHYKYVSNLQTLFRYDYYTIDLENRYYLKEIINKHFPIIQHYIEYNNIQTVHFKIVNRISKTNFNNKTSQFIVNELFDPKYSNFWNIIVLVNLIKQINFDEQTELWIHNTYIKIFYNNWCEYKINFDVILKMIEKNFSSNVITKLDVLNNPVITRSKMNKIQDCFEYKFISIIDHLSEKFILTDVHDFLKRLESE